MKLSTRLYTVRALGPSLHSKLRCTLVDPVILPSQDPRMDLPDLGISHDNILTVMVKVNSMHLE